ncbi:glutamate racemase [Mycobacterium sp. NPDC003449]
MTRPATVGIFDAGIGGLPLASMMRKRAPQHRIVYLGDAARRPYGPRPAAEVARFVAEEERFFVTQGCDVWVIACNTASVVAADALRRTIPAIDMLTAIEAAARDTPPGPVGVLATAGTVASGVVPRVLTGRVVHQLATEDLLRLAEEGITDRRVDPLIGEAVHFLREHHCGTAVLACTDFTCILDRLRSAAGNIRLLDPLDTAVELVLEHLDGCSSRAPRAEGDRLCLTGRHPVDVERYAAETYGLDLGPATYVTLS